MPRAATAPRTAATSAPAAKTPVKQPGADDSADALVQFIVRTASEIPRTLNEQKSVTSAARGRANELATAIASAARLLANKIPDPDSTVLDSSIRESASAAVVRDVVREELDKFRQEFVQRPTPPASYAAAVSSGPRRPKIKTPVSRPAIVIKSAADDVKSSKDVVQEFRKSVTFQDVSFGPARVQPVSNGAVRVEFDDVQQRDAALRKVSDVRRLKAEPAKQRRPLLILKGISRDVREDDVVGLIGRQNPGLQLADGDVRKRFVRRNRKDDLYNVVLEVSAGVRVRMLESGRLAVDHQRVHVSDFSSVVQCYKCLGFGHTRAKCTSDVQRCSHCSSEGHDFASCPDKADDSKLKCHNCATSGRRTSDVQHSATSAKKCPHFKAMEKRIQARTDYGC